MTKIKFIAKNLEDEEKLSSLGNSIKTTLKYKLKLGVSGFAGDFYRKGDETGAKYIFDIGNRKINQVNNLLDVNKRRFTDQAIKYGVRELEWIVSED
jgi:hypothetical protein